MTFTYYPSFDMARVSPGTLELVTPGKPAIQLNLSALTAANAYFTFASVFNHLVNSTAYTGPDRGRTALLGRMPGFTFAGAVQFELRALATEEGWTTPNDLFVFYEASEQRYYFQYASGLTTIEWSQASGRRLFGFTANYSGVSQAEHVGTQVPNYVLNATLEQPSMMSIVSEDDPMATMAHSATGRAYAMGRTGTVMRQTWVQQYESKAKTWRRFADAAPNEYTFQQLYEDCRAGLPFGAGDYENSWMSAYTFDVNQDAFHPLPATPGNATQFHIPFNTIVLGVQL